MNKKSSLELCRHLGLKNEAEWLWEIHNLSAETLRAACLHECAREVPALLDLVEQIDAKLEALGLDEEFCQLVMKYKAFGYGTPSLKWSLDVSDEEYKQRIQVVTDIEKLARLVWPMSPHLLLCKKLRTTPFFSLKPEQVYTNWDLLVTAKKEEADIPELNAIGQTLYCPRYWVAEIAPEDYYYITDGNRHEAAKNWKAKPEHEMRFLHDPSEGLFLDEPGNEVEVEALVAERDVFELYHPTILLRAAIFGPSTLPKKLRGRVFRMKFAVRLGEPIIEVSKDLDGLATFVPSEQLVMVAVKEDDGRHNYPLAISDAVNLCRLKPGRSSVLSDERRIAPNKLNYFFYETVLCRLSGLRMGHTINDVEFDAMVRAITEPSSKADQKEDSNSGDKKGVKLRNRIASGRIPYTNRVQAMETKKLFTEMLKDVFPMVPEESLVPRCIEGGWTIKQ